VIFVREVAHAGWHVTGHGTTLGPCRKSRPMWLGCALRVVLKLKKILREPASLMAG
jgi:hypothetical protein